MIRIQDLHFRYPRSDFSLRIPDWSVLDGETVAIIGPSGSGKTTLLQILAGIQRPNSGRVEVQGQEFGTLNDTQKRAFRIQKIGLVFQDFALIEYLSVLENILLPARINPVLKISKTLKDRAVQLAQTLGLSNHLDRPIPKLSQGEKQRVAVCRSLLFEPPLILADEPTGNLDPMNKGLVLDSLFACVRASKATLVVVTHDRDLLDRFDRIVDFKSFYQTPETAGVKS